LENKCALDVDWVAARTCAWSCFQAGNGYGETCCDPAPSHGRAPSGPRPRAPGRSRHCHSGRRSPDRNRPGLLPSAWALTRRPAWPPSPRHRPCFRRLAIRRTLSCCDSGLLVCVFTCSG